MSWNSTVPTSSQGRLGYTPAQPRTLTGITKSPVGCVVTRSSGLTMKAYLQTLALR